MQLSYTMDHVLAAIIDCCADGQATEASIRDSLSLCGVDPFDINYGLNIAIGKHRWIALIDPDDPVPSYGTTKAGRTSRKVLPSLGEPSGAIPDRVSMDVLSGFYSAAKGRQI